MTQKAYRGGTHRAVAPEVTLERIRPLRSLHGITRLADVTGLDCFGIPTYCAVRPTAMIVQVSNGKGMRPVDAQVGALMESLEVAHAEGPPSSSLLLASRGEMQARGERFCLDLPAEVAPARAPVGRIEWARGMDLKSKEPVWLPAGAAWVRERRVCSFSSNGLASGNTLVEATLHALYEVLERHLLSHFVVGDEFAIESADVLDPDSISDPGIGELVSRIRSAGVKLVLLRARSRVLHAFIAVLLDPDPLGGASAVNIGSGAHLSPSVAVSRAITEAAQSRLTFIHGSREDLCADNYTLGPRHARVYDFFDSTAMNAEWEWGELVDRSNDDLDDDLDLLLRITSSERLGRVFRIDMSHPGSPIFVVKVVIPAALHEGG
jgi:ribosomal protein S12 methylthiotransferase accessory factor